MHLLLEMYGVLKGAEPFFMPRLVVASLLVAMIKLLYKLQMLTLGELRSIKLVSSGLKFLQAHGYTLHTNTTMQ